MNTRPVFADSCYWIALVFPADPWHDAARRAGQAIEERRIVTTDEVLVEFLNFFSGRGPHFRAMALRAFDTLMLDDRAEVIAQSRATLQQGVALYRGRGDKPYSLTDCISMAVMRARGISAVLSHDRHFTQEGFTVLL
jgi:uncharacterized protein